MTYENVHCEHVNIFLVFVFKLTVILHLSPAALHSCCVEALHHHYAQLQFHCVPCCGGKCPGAADHLEQGGTGHSLGV